MSLNYQIIGKRLRRYRKKQHLSQLTIAERIGKSPSYLSYLESGSKHPSLETLVNIINVLGASADSEQNGCKHRIPADPIGL